MLYSMHADTSVTPEGGGGGAAEGGRTSPYMTVPTLLELETIFHHPLPPSRLRLDEALTQRALPSHPAPRVSRYINEY